MKALHLLYRESGRWRSAVGEQLWLASFTYLSIDLGLPKETGVSDSPIPLISFRRAWFDSKPRFQEVSMVSLREILPASGYRSSNYSLFSILFSSFSHVRSFLRQDEDCSLFSILFSSYFHVRSFLRQDAEKQ
jgi:hypothetical protein